MEMFKMPQGEKNSNKNEQIKKVDYLASNVKVSDAEMEDLIDKFLRRPENQNVEITRETAKMAVESELERASKKIGKMYSENDDQKLAA